MNGIGIYSDILPMLFYKYEGNYATNLFEQSSLQIFAFEQCRLCLRIGKVEKFSQ